jgi:hypothetical protein
MLDGNGVTALNGIVNQYSEELTYVNRVNLYQILGTGLSLVSPGSTGANNSGPYSNISFSTNGGGAAGTVCTSISGARTRGIRGLTCTADSTPSAAVTLDGNSNSIEDVHIEGFKDGILIGSNESSAGNILANINGGTTAGPTSNLIHISSLNAVTDLSIVGVYNEDPGVTPTTIQDDVTSTTLTDTSVGMYVLGETVGTSGASRFSTSPNAVTWGVGAGAPSGTCKAGSLYSNTSPLGTSTTLYVCVPSTLSNVWTGLTIP